MTIMLDWKSSTCSFITCAPAPFCNSFGELQLPRSQHASEWYKKKTTKKTNVSSSFGLKEKEEWAESHTATIKAIHPGLWESKHTQSLTRWRFNFCFLYLKLEHTLQFDREMPKMKKSCVLWLGDVLSFCSACCLIRMHVQYCMHLTSKLHFWLGSFNQCLFVSNSKTAK